MFAAAAQTSDAAQTTDGELGMRARWVGWWLLVPFLLLASTCTDAPRELRPSHRPAGDGGSGGRSAGGAGGDGAAGGSGGTQQPGGTGGGFDGGADCFGFEGGVPAAFGLDERPFNTTCLAPPRPSTGAPVRLVRVFREHRFTQPLGLVQAPHQPARWYVVEKRGTIQRFDANGGDAEEVLDLRDQVEDRPDEAGLLGLAFHPRFPADDRAFVYYTARGSRGLRFVLSSFRSSDGGLTLDPGSERVLLELDNDDDAHCGGQLAFGPDGMLYVAVGDGSSGKRSRRLDTLFGKLLRLDVSGADYAIPAGNPFGEDGDERGEIWAYGFRNPWRFSFDAHTGDLWLADVGKADREEVDLVVPGGDYGWDAWEGTLCHDCRVDGTIAPVVEYSHAEGRAIVGGHVYRGTAIPALQGAFVFGDFISGRIWGLFPDEASPRLLAETGINPASFGQGADGEIYVVDHAGGGVWQIVPDGDPEDGFPRRLSETGCMDPADPKRPGPALIPYDVNVPLWSDGSAKARWFAIPDGATITIDENGDWHFPIGSVLVKTFLVECRPVETRLFVLHDDGGWAGYAYEWNEEGTDAFLLATGKVRAVEPGKGWTYPSRAHCMQCHTAAAGRTLGPETAQLNREIRWPDGRRANIVDTLAHVGMFANPPGPAANLPALPDPFGDAPLADRARSYLHANCASCHRPDGSGQGDADFRWDAEEMEVCGAEPDEGDLGVAGALLLAPGQPERSLVALRMRSLGAGRMPPVGSAVVDEPGVELIEAWIRGHPPCD